MWHRRIVPTVLLLSSVLPLRAYAHCDGMDGPVVKAAQAALEQHDVDLVFIWVLEEYEPEIRNAFQRTLAVRSLGPEAMELADMYFFETVVRLHRLGEGAPYTGLKPGGRDLGPAIPAADRALETGDLAPLLELLTNELRAALQAHFQEAVWAGEYMASDVEAGREFVAQYVTFIHYVERAYETARSNVHGHFPEASDGSTDRSDR